MQNQPTIDPTPAELPARRTLLGQTVRLEPLAPMADAEDLFTGSHGDSIRESVWEHMPYGPFPSHEAMKRWLRHRATLDDPLVFSVHHQTTNRRVGMVSFLRQSPSHRVLEVGHIWYVPEVQRTKVNTESVYLLLREAFDLGYRRVEWKCDARNQRSRQAALRLGFSYEGTFRQHKIVKGQNRDTAWFAMLDLDWPAVRERIEAWLAAPVASHSLTSSTVEAPSNSYSQSAGATKPR